MGGRSPTEATPLTVIGGYLGAGKTTLINRLLADPGDRRIAVLVNDFGAVNIDAELIVAQDGDTISLANGCVCCSFADGLAMALIDLRERIESDGDIDHVVIEVSGVGDPWKVAQWGRTPGFSLDGVVVLAAADSVMAKAQDPLVGETVRQQLRGADLVLVTRADLVDDAGEVAAWVRTEGRLEGRSEGSSSVWIGMSAQVPVGLVLGGHETAGASSAGDHHRFATWAVEVPPCAPGDLERWLRDAPDEVWRAKGVVSCVGGDVVAQRVGRRVEVTAAPDGAASGPVVVVAEVRSSEADEWSARGRRLDGGPPNGGDRTAFAT